MKSLISGALTSALLVALCAANPRASAAGAERSYDIRTRIFAQQTSVGEADGSMKLDISADGTVAGYYRPDTNDRIEPVIGGVSGDRFWIVIGTFGARPLRFHGTFAGGTIEAQASPVLLTAGRFVSLELVGTSKAN